MTVRRRRVPVERADVLPLGASSVLAMVGGLQVWEGDRGGWWLLGFFGLCALVLAFAPWIRAWRSPPPMDLVVSARGVRLRGARKAGDDAFVAWDALREVSILTTSDGPLTEDVFFVLQGADAAPMVIPQSLAFDHELLDALQARLSGFDNEAVVAAMGSTQDARFLLWSASAAH